MRKAILLGLVLCFIPCSLVYGQTIPMRFKVLDAPQQNVIVEGTLTVLSYSDNLLLIVSPDAKSTSPPSTSTIINFVVDGVVKPLTIDKIEIRLK